ncbi:DUF1194 domain-containing protein [Paradevosia shaoguanensis]|uniref:DUF1194 domain-containing protein n=1 Tax=Paradevosia shaoguanensis TaxID=1335043 RepID=UPI003C777710
MTVFINQTRRLACAATWLLAPICLALCIAFGLLAGPALAQAAATAKPPPMVDKRIILLIDSSRSMTDEHYSWQLNGFADAFLSDESIEAIAEGKNSSIAMALVQFSSRVSVSLDWTIIDPSNIEAFAAKLRTVPRFRPDSTSIGLGLSKAGQMIEKTKIQAVQTIIIVSGDGPNNVGFPPYPISEEISSWLKTTIVGIALESAEEYELETYYRKFVARGPGNFVVWARSEEDLKNALVRVLTLNSN